MEIRGPTTERRDTRPYRGETDDLDDDLLDDDEGGMEDDDDFPDDEEAHEAYVAFRNAKSKYQSMMKERGCGQQPKEERLKQAKARSYCSVCHRKGHWQQDPECPANKGKSGSTPLTMHVVYYTGNNAKEPNTDFLAITDCACSRTLAGRKWAGHFIKFIKENHVPYFLMEQNEVFKFGGEKLYPSKAALVTWLAINNEWFLAKISVVGADVPLTRTCSAGHEL